MENLEKQIINRLNKVLNKYDLAIISRYNFSYKTMNDPYNIVTKHNINKCILVKFEDNTIIGCYHSWDNFEFMLLSSVYNCSFFNSINIAHERVKQYNNIVVNSYENYLLLDKLYNELHSLNNCFCIEELMIKMDLMGI